MSNSENTGCEQKRPTDVNRSNVVSSSNSLCSCSQLSSACGHIQLEPVLFIQNMVSQMVWVTSQDLMVEKTCRVNHDLSPSVCDNLPAHDFTDEAIDDEVSEFLMWRNIFETSIKFVVVLFMGPWSDRIGRRAPLILCLSLLMGESALMLLNASCKSWPLEMMLVCSVPYALSGGQYALLMLAFAHTSDTTLTRRRTFRMGYLDTFWYFGSSIGLAITPAIRNAAGYAGIFGTSMVLYVVTIVYVFVRLRKESSDGNRAIEGDFCGACSLNHINHSIEVVSRARPNRARTFILLLITVMMLDSLATSGDLNVRYLFVKRAVDWTSSEYSYWSSLTSILSVTGGFLFVPLVTLQFGLLDPAVGMLGSFSRFMACLSYATVNSPSEGWLLYFGSLLGCFSVLAPVSVRSCLSKLARSDIGSVFAVMAACESFIPFLSAPIYRSIYAATNTYHPGYYNFFSMVVYFTMIALFWWLNRALRSVRES